MRIYLVRHGDPDYSTDSLTHAGQQEAAALADYMASMSIDGLFVSPMGRARQTASYTETALAMQAEVLPWTAELDLRTEDGSGRAAWDENPTVLRQDTLEFPAAWQRVVDQVAAQSDAWVASLGWQRTGLSYRALPNLRQDRQVALFCHGGFGLTWLAHILAIPAPVMWSAFFLHTSSITTILFDEREKGVATPRIIGMSALPHVYYAGLRPQIMGIKANYF